ncbi:hypothetical protein CFC21_083432 [Triticum aestivum]|uniref:Uncharacterized protein n=2 Tax=Triticum aestivum TaxID=4565 RepID=A0A9R1I8P5_WHEAT|nr:hypothetical protein CFC21_083432 [Triticum aestivum]
MCYLQEKRWKEQEVEVSSQHMNNRGLQVLQKTKAEELGYDMQRDEIFVRAHTRKIGVPTAQAETLIKQPEETAEPPTTLAMEIQFHRQDEQVSTLLGHTEKMQR